MQPRLVVPVILDGPLEPIEEVPEITTEPDLNVSDCNGSECNTTNATLAAGEPKKGSVKRLSLHLR